MSPGRKAPGSEAASAWAADSVPQVRAQAHGFSFGFCVLSPGLLPKTCLPGSPPHSHSSPHGGVTDTQDVQVRLSVSTWMHTCETGTTLRTARATSSQVAWCPCHPFASAGHCHSAVCLLWTSHKRITTQHAGSHRSDSERPDPPRERQAGGRNMGLCAEGALTSSLESHQRPTVLTGAKEEPAPQRNTNNRPTR